MCCKALDAFSLRHFCISLHPRYDQGLGNFRQSVLYIQGCCRSKTCAHSRTALIIDIRFLQRIHLFSDCPINTGISCVKSYYHSAFPLRFFHDIKHFLQCQSGTVMNLTRRFRIGKQLRVYQRARIDDNIRLLQQTHSSDSDQIGCACSCANKVNHSPAPSLFASSPYSFSYKIQSVFIFPLARFSI